MIQIELREGYELSSIIQLLVGNYHLAVKRTLVTRNGAKLAIYGNATAPLVGIATALQAAYNNCDANYERISAHIAQGGRYVPQPRHNPKLEIDIDLSDI